jgi:hypothetical protein
MVQMTVRVKLAQKARKDPTRPQETRSPLNQPSRIGACAKIDEINRELRAGG